MAGTRNIRSRVCGYLIRIVERSLLMPFVEQSTIINAPVALVMEALNDVESIPTWASVSGKIENVKKFRLSSNLRWCPDFQLDFSAVLHLGRLPESSKPPRISSGQNWKINHFIDALYFYVDCYLINYCVCVSIFSLVLKLGSQKGAQGCTSWGYSFKNGWAFHNFQ